MGEFIIKNKGFKELYLNGSYNSNFLYRPFRDDAHFTEGSNDFYDYLYQSTCGIWQNDKIKILSLPDKGKLFYLTNPNGGAPVFSNVSIGQMFLVRDLIDNKILKFNAEGFFDSQFSGNYLTQFSIERFCGIQSSNIISTVKLNMIDGQVDINDKYDIFISQSCNIISGDSPNNYQTLCQGNQNFSLASKLATSVGYLRMTYDGTTPELGLKKNNGSPLVLLELMSMNQVINAYLYSPGINSPSAYPFGYPSQPVDSIYTFQYSLDGLNNWIYLDMVVKNA